MIFGGDGDLAWRKLLPAVYNLNVDGALPSHFAVVCFGLPSTKTMSWHGNAAFSGVVYAPEAFFTMGGGGSTAYDFQGACTVGSMKLNGNFNLHYDEYLRHLGVLSSGFTVTYWQELPASH